MNLKILLNNKFFVIYLLPFLLGVVTIFGFSPYNFTFINFFSFSILLHLILLIKKKTKSIYIKKKTNRYFFFLGSSFGLGFFLFGNYWISISLTHDEGFKYLIPFAFILIPLFLSLFFGFVCLIVGPFSERNIFFILFFSLIFSIFEFLRGNILTGFPWNLISYTWSWSIEFTQILSIIGTYSLSLISITFFCIPFLFFNGIVFKKNIIFLSLFFILFSINYLYGLNKIRVNNYDFDENISVKIVSPNFSLKDYQEKSEASQLKRLIKISAPQKDKNTLFIWPEGVFYESYLQDIAMYKDLFIEKFSENHLIILGINNFTSSSDHNKYFNSLVILNHKAEILSIYNKINLVPFGEFLPFETFFSRFGLKKITRGYNSFSSGNKRELIQLGKNFGDTLILPTICYEIIYSGKIKKEDQFPDILVNISEDAWFGDSIGPHQHYTKAIFRAIEEGVFIARAANKGISGFINPNGRSIKFLSTSEPGNVELKMPRFSKQTFYSNYGNKIFLLIIFLYIFLTLICKKFKI
jgi:apolipoprotein N-acyltransferase